MGRFVALVAGPQDIGTTRRFWVGFALVLLGFFLLPLYMDPFDIYNLAFSIMYIPVALGLSLLWGYGGVLSFGQVAFVGIGGYMYGIIAGNLIGNPYASLLGMAGAILAAGLVALIFGYFVFYGRVQMWIFPIVTLVFTLVLERFLAQTAGRQWRVGNVFLGGYNGMTGIPPLEVGSYYFDEVPFYYVVLVTVVVLYLLLRAFVNSPRGHVLVAMREDEVRTELLGYDTRLMRLYTFAISAMLASLSGVFYVQWGSYISPSEIGLQQAALPVIWAAVGGRDRLLAVMISTFVLNQITFELASQGSPYGLILMGALVLAVMMFFPRGIVTMLAEGLRFQGRTQAAGPVPARVGARGRAKSA